MRERQAEPRIDPLEEANARDVPSSSEVQVEQADASQPTFASLGGRVPRSFEEDCARVNFERLPLAAVVLAALHLLHIVLFLPAVDADGTPEDRWQLMIGAAHAVMLPFAAAAYFVLRRLALDALRWRHVPAVIACVYLVFSAVVTGFDQIAAATPIAFVIGAIGLSSLVRLGLWQNITIYAIGASVVLVCVEVWQGDDSLRRSVQVNCLTITGISLLIARSSARLHRRIWEDRRIILHQAQTDQLTGSLTRGAFLEVARAAVGRPCALGLIDIDNLKLINDRAGHAAGDAAIVAVARAVRGAIRAHDLLGRLGGDELCVLLPGADDPAARVIAERIRASAEKTGATVSVGVASAVAGESAERWLARADAAMYRAKSDGRNRVNS